jgi:hypothetical protein
MAAQGQITAPAQAERETVRAEIGAPLKKALAQTEARNYAAAFAVLDGLEKVPNKTPHELSMIAQMRQFVIVRSNGPTEQQTR